VRLKHNNIAHDTLMVAYLAFRQALAIGQQQQWHLVLGVEGNILLRAQATQLRWRHDVELVLQTFLVDYVSQLQQAPSQ
jgi:hypothetical protein